MVGNRAVSGLIHHSQSAAAIQRLTISETAHYSSDRDEAHSKAKAALLAADSDESISNKIFGKHRAKTHGGKCVTSFKTSGGGYLVTVTYADLARQILKYDTAFLSKTVANAPEASAITYNPESPTITVS
jgi:hypothetical protein